MQDIVCPIEMFDLEQVIFINKEPTIVPNSVLVSFLADYCKEHLVTKVTFVGFKKYIEKEYAVKLALLIPDVKIEVLEG